MSLAQDAAGPAGWGIGMSALWDRTASDGPLLVATSNLFVGAVKRRPRRVRKALVHAVATHHVVLCQETGEADEILRDVRRDTDCHVYQGAGKSGQEKMTILVAAGRGIRGVGFRSHRLTRTDRVVGIGAGPSRTTKWLHVATFTYGGDRYAAIDMHQLASQYRPLRKAVARRMSTKAAKIVRDYQARGFHVILGGDLNNTPGAWTLQPLYGPLRSGQRRRGPIPTHGKHLPRRGRAIDDLLWTRDLRCVHFEALATPSDHQLVSASFVPRGRRFDPGQWAIDITPKEEAAA